jgi:uncharacterized membrane protein
MVLNMKSLLAFSLAISFMFVFLAASVHAANFDFQVSPSLVSICPCNSVTPQHVQVSVKNLYQYADTYSFTADAPPGFTATIQQNLVVNPGDTGSLDLFLVDVRCSVVPGDYHINIKAKSGTTGELQTKSLGLNVLNCYEVSISADAKYKEMCSEENKTAIYYMTIQNRGRYSDTYDLSASVSWVVFSEKTVVVDAGKNKTVAMAVLPPADIKGLQFINVQAKSRNFFSSDSETFQLNILDCYSMSVDLQPTETTACLGQIVDQKVTIINTGLNNDTYSIFTPSWVTATKPSVSIEPKKSADISLMLQPTQKGKTTFNITVISGKDPTLQKVLPSAVAVQECRGVAVIASPSQSKVCQGAEADFTISVKNMGTLVDIFNITASMGAPDSGKITVNPGDTKEVMLRISNITKPGTYKVRVNAQAGDVSDEDIINLTVENCYAASMDVSPQNQSVCFGTPVNYTVVVKNMGKLADTYTLRLDSQFMNATKQLAISPGQADTEYFTVQVPSEPQAKDYSIKFSLQSGQLSTSGQAILTVKPKSSCYSVQLISSDQKFVQICNASILPITVKNTGEKKDTFSLTIDGPAWAYLSPNSVELGGGQQQQVYVYLSPCFNAEKKAYSIGIKASSPSSQVQKNISVNVVANLTGLEIPPQNQTIPAGNITGGNVTGLILGLDSNGWKLVAIVIITIVIIIILAIRFILLAKK